MPQDLNALIARREKILSRVQQVLVTELKVRRIPETIDPDTPLFGTGLRLDSVDAVELIIAVESAFGLRLKEGEIGSTQLRTLNTLVDFLITREADHANRS